MVDKKTEDHQVCIECGEFHDFVLDHHIIDELLEGRVVIFAGAGISTENKSVFPHTFYEEIKSELAIASDTEMPFAELMTRYCSQPNGRIKLLQKIQERLKYVRAFPGQYQLATRFHHELSTIYHIDTIVTTNWDDYFERECDATPFVTDQDFALWNTPGRKVLKIHGSVNNYGSIIAENKDYKICFRSMRNGMLGSTLKQALGTKTIIYVGYSFRDTDFIKLRRFLTKNMGSLMPRSYIITLDRDTDSRFKALGLIPIYTDATFFLMVLKRHLVSNRQMLDDERFEGVLTELARINSENLRLHKAFNYRRHPEIAYASCYQDGLQHAFERILALKKSGAYSHVCHIQDSIQSYMQIRQDRLKERKYFDVAYVDGYINGLVYLLQDDKTRKFLPRYYVFGERYQPRSLFDYNQVLKKSRHIHKSSYKYAVKIIKQKTLNDPNLVLTHTPFL